MKFNKSNAYTDFDYETAEEMPVLFHLISSVGDVICMVIF